jgi:magnesium-protoporphyrin IX monomethyl ester (oxidative) cyclase
MKGYKEDLTPPLGLAYIAAVLEERAYDVKILDVSAEDFYNREEIGEEYIQIGLSNGEIKTRIRDFDPDVVGISCLLSSQFHDMCNICKLAKEINERIITVVGGAHPSALPEESLMNDYIDFVVIGEGEYTMLELMEAIKRGYDFSKIDGLGFKQGKRIVVNPKTKFIEDLDELPLPARHLLPMETYFKTNLPHSGTSRRSPNTPIMTSRGCTGHCIFCATAKFWGRRYRTRSVDKVLDEMVYLIKEYGVKEIQFIDDNLTLNKKRAIELFNRMIERNLNLVWNTPQGIAVSTLDEEILQKMKESGCYEITLAIESGDEKVLNYIIKKPLKLEKVEQQVKTARKLGIITKGYFVVGLPGETKAQMQKTFDFAKRLKLDAAGIFIAAPLPGTELYRLCREKNYLKSGFSFKKINYATGNIETPDFTAREVEKLVSKNILRINMGLILRNPLKFVKKYFSTFCSNPRPFINYIFFLLVNTQGKQAQGTQY